MTYADRIERKWIIVVCAIIIAVAGFGFGQFTEAALIIACGLAITFANTTLSFAYHAYQTQAWPARIRARGAGLVYSVSRIGAMFSGFIVAWILKNGGVTSVFGLITAAMLIVVLVIAAFGPRTRHLTAV